MKKENYTYYKTQLLSLLVRATLVLSVLSFSGLNLQAHSQANTVVRTELTETRIRKPDYKLDFQSKIIFSSTPSYCCNFYSQSILGFYNILRSKFKSYKNRILLYYLLPINKQIKIPTSSSKDEKPLYLI